MKRIMIGPRSTDYHAAITARYPWHTRAGTPQWREDAYYEFTPADVERLTQAAETVHGFYSDAGSETIRKQELPIIGIDPRVTERVAKWWDDDVPAICGRMDFIYDGTTPKMLGYANDAPANFTEAGLMQALWREEVASQFGQFNSLQEAVTERWREILRGRPSRLLHVMADAGIPEDSENATFMGQCAVDAGFEYQYIDAGDIGVGDGKFYDLQDRQMTLIYKQYPWTEWVRRDLERKEAGQSHYLPYVDANNAWWIEPMWKMVYENGLLPIIWDHYFEHPNLLATYTDDSELRGRGSYVMKPLAGLGGQAIRLYDTDGNIITRSSGNPTTEGCIYQAYREPPDMGGYMPVVSVWMVAGTAVAISVREDTGRIVQRTSRFVPHIVV